MRVRDLLAVNLPAFGLYASQIDGLAHRSFNVVARKASTRDMLFFNDVLSLTGPDTR